MLKEVKEVLVLKMSTMLGVRENEFFERSKVFKGVLCSNFTMYFNPGNVMSLPLVRVSGAPSSNTHLPNSNDEVKRSWSVEPQ